VPIPSFYGADKVIHGIEYAILGLLLARSIFSSKPRFSNRSLIISIVTLATLYGISDEIHQAFVLGRNASFWDVLADGSGSLIGALFYLKIYNYSGSKFQGSRLPVRRTQTGFKLESDEESSQL